jgi:hypothetical protein
LHAAQSQGVDRAPDPLDVEPHRELGSVHGHDVESLHGEVDQPPGLHIALHHRALLAQRCKGFLEGRRRRHDPRAAGQVLHDRRHLAGNGSEHQRVTGEREVERHLGLWRHQRDQRRVSDLAHFLLQHALRLLLHRVQGELDDLSPLCGGVPEVDLRDDAEVRHRLSRPVIAIIFLAGPQIHGGDGEAEPVYAQLHQGVGIERQLPLLMGLARPFERLLDLALEHLE